MSRVESKHEGALIGLWVDGTQACQASSAHEETDPTSRFPFDAPTICLP